MADPFYLGPLYIQATAAEDAIGTVRVDDAAAPTKLVIQVGTATAVYLTLLKNPPAADIVNTPAGTVSSTDVQAAINELDTEKQAVALKDQASGYAGLSSVMRVTKGCITTDDLIVNDHAKGCVLKDDAGSPHYWRISVSALGVLSTADLGTSPP